MSAQDWTHSAGPRSQRRWVNSRTQEVVYSDENPGGKDRQGKPDDTGDRKPGKGGEPTDRQPSEKPAPAKPAPKNDGTLSHATMEYVRAKPGGANAGGVYRDHDGSEWLIKHGASDDHARNEVLAGRLYELAGVATPDIRLFTGADGKQSVASKWMANIKNAPEDAIANAHKAYAGFATDAWLGNWDVAGSGQDNLFVSDHGDVLRGDIGGALRYRATGGAKGDKFGAEVGETKSLRDQKMNPGGHNIFKGMTKDDIHASVANVLKIKDDDIKSAVERYGPEDAGEREKLAKTLIARKKNLGEQYPEAKKLVPKEAKVPKVSPEEAAADYKANGTKAASFKGWFGDWESGMGDHSRVIDPKSREPQKTGAFSGAGSVVADKEGKPIVVYHGTPLKEGFEAFDPDKAGKNLAFGKGLYFGGGDAKKGIDETYGVGQGGKTFECYLNIRKPFDLDRKYTPQEYEAVTGRKWGVWKKFTRAMSSKTTDHITGMELHKEIAAQLSKGRLGGDLDAANARLRRAGFDGITHTSGISGGNASGRERVWIAFDANQVKSTDNRGTFDPDDKRMAFSETPVKPKRKFASTQFDLAAGSYSRKQGNPAYTILGMALSIPDVDLADDGRENRPHVTVKYGIHADDVDDVRKAVAGFGAVQIKLGKTSLFAAADGRDYDVVKIDVEGDALRALNGRISTSLECTDTHPTYNPHVTIAYVKAGLGKKYVGATTVEGQTLSLHRLIFSSKDREETEIDTLPDDLWTFSEDFHELPDAVAAICRDVYADLIASFAEIPTATLRSSLPVGIPVATLQDSWKKQLRDNIGRWARTLGDKLDIVKRAAKNLWHDNQGANVLADNVNEIAHDAGKIAAAVDNVKLAGEKIRDAWEAIRGAVTTDDGIPVAVDREGIDAALGEFRATSSEAAIARAGALLSPYKITSVFMTDLQHSATLRNLAVNDPGHFDRLINYVEDNLNTGLHLAAADSPTTTYAKRSLDQVDALRADVNAFRGKHQPELARSIYTPAPGVKPREKPATKEEVHAATAAVAEIAKRALTADTAVASDIAVDAGTAETVKGAVPVLAGSPSTSGASGGDKPHHYGRKGAAGINTTAAIDHITAGGTVESAVDHVMKTGGVTKATSRRYVRAAVLAMKTESRKRVARLKKELTISDAELRDFGNEVSKPVGGGVA